MSGLDSLIQWLDDPTAAFVLLGVGMAALMVEAARPGTIGTGIGGAIAVLAGLWSLSMQSVTAVGLALVVLAAVLYAVEIFTPSPGVAGFFGSVSLVLGGLLLIDDPAGGVPLGVILPAAVL